MQRKKKYIGLGLFSIWLIFAVVYTVMSAGPSCTTYDGTDGYLVNESTTFCTGTYHKYLGRLDLGIQINSDNVVLDCNHTSFIMKGSGRMIYFSGIF